MASSVVWTTQPALFGARAGAARGDYAVCCDADGAATPESRVGSRRPARAPAQRAGRRSDRNRRGMRGICRAAENLRAIIMPYT
eukprot:1693193-Prymnesium_polylepis.2